MRSFALAAVTAICLTGAAATAAPTDAGRLEFEVLRNGQPFGRHTIVVSGAGENLRARSNVELRVDLGPLTVFRFEQDCAETWSQGRLAGLQCSTLKDGRRTIVRAVRDGEQLRVAGADGETLFPLNAFPASWWTKPPEGAVLIDTETGELMRARVIYMGRETIDVGGRQIAADRVRVTGTVAGDLWYDADGRWVACAFRARGQNIEYRLRTPLSGAPA